MLQLISHSRGALAPVFDALVERAMRLCEASYGHVYTYDGEFFHLAVAHGERRYVDWIQQSGPRLATSSLTFPRIVAGELVAHIGDITAEPSYRSGESSRARTIVEKYGIRTLLSVALRKDGILLGTVVLYRQEPRPFTDEQVELVQNFAAQAVIAIENARLLNELRQRTDDLSEALEQQTATSEVLKVISSSTGELQPVFQAMLENAIKLCEAKFGILFRYEEGAFRPAAMLNVPRAHADLLRQRGRFLPEPGIPLDRVWKTKQLVHTIDEAASPNPAPSARLAGARSHICVPMLKDDELVGAIVIYRQEVRPFTDKQIELVKNFAAQAVIAIENTRLLSELRESLQQQTATADVLKVISSSPGELAPVFQAMLTKATQLCDAKFGTLNLYDGEAFHNVAVHNVPPAYAEVRQGKRVTPHPGSGHAEALRTKRVVQIDDLRTLRAYREGDPAAVAIADIGGARSMLIMPMLKDEELIGVIVIYRQEVRPFTDKQIELVKNFAAQAVIAIENARLLNELRRISLQQQTATADVLKVISTARRSSSPCFRDNAEKRRPNL